jgi:hypothetical protein
MGIMALGELTKQIAQQAILSATSKEPAPPPQPDSVAALMLGQLQAMQKALKEEEELVVLYQSGGEKVRVLEITAVSGQLAVLTGPDHERNRTRVLAPFDTLQLICKVYKVAAGAKALRVSLSPKPKE